MTKDDLKIKTAEAKADIKNALQIVYDSLNHGQQQKLLKDDEVKALFELYGVEV